MLPNSAITHLSPSLQSDVVLSLLARAGPLQLTRDIMLDWAEERGVLGVDIEAYHRNTPASVLYRTSGFWRLGRERFHLKLDPVEE